MNRPILYLAAGLLAAGASTETSSQEVPSWAAPVAPAGPPVGPQAASSAADPGGAPAPPNTPTPVPIDGGLGLLALAGGAYAARRLRQTR
ncbi:MAG: hypothetical protein AAGK21_15850 [Bacteroidota bacterium]